MKAIIVGAGIGGLTTALFLHKYGLDCEIYERAPEIQELGVGINLMPQAISTFEEIGLLGDIEAEGITPEHLYYRTFSGLTAWDEPRGRAAGLPVPQISVHRGRLQAVLYRAFQARVPGAVHTDRGFVGYEETDSGVTATFRSADGTTHTATGDILIGADGIHSELRRILYPEEGSPRWSGRVMWRGTADWPAFGEGKTFVIAGSIDTRLVLFPIAKGDTPGTLRTNWVLVHRAADDGTALPPAQDWQGKADRAKCLEALEPFDLPDLDIRALAEATTDIFEFPMSDRDPLPRWSVGRVTLLGDAAHPMYPFGGNGAAQAILDAKALAGALAAESDPVAALANYEDERRERVYQVVMTNRQGGPERVIDMVEARIAAEGIAPADIPREERAEIVHGYSRLAGYSPEQLNRAAS
ncbi:FAD-dependent monooxygenase [Amorphus sp. 3PC139-8]|uniref:FAD-dependent monooxygenase n=1 Tax=Amorphus sp. 3PC139-8 TaxID=2735676 RepID=UPI00345D5B82